MVLMAGRGGAALGSLSGAWPWLVFNSLLVGPKSPT